MIYQLENSWKERSAEYRKDHRQRILKLLIDEYFRWVREQIQNCAVLPNSETGKGFTCSIAETAKANNLKPFQFFEYFLTELQKEWKFEFQQEGIFDSPNDRKYESLEFKMKL